MRVPQRYQGFGFQRTGPVTIGITPPPTILVQAPPPALPETPPPVTPEIVTTSTPIPISDPRHPQHEAWLASRQTIPGPSEGAGGFPKWLFVVGGLAVVGMGAYLVLKKKKAGPQPLGRYSSYEFSSGDDDEEDDDEEDDDLGDDD